MKRIKTFLFLAARRYEYLDEDSPDPEESDQPDRGPSLSPGPPADFLSTVTNVNSIFPRKLVHIDRSILL